MDKKTALDINQPLQYTANPAMGVEFLCNRRKARGEVRLVFKLTVEEGVEDLLETDAEGNCDLGWKVVNVVGIRAEKYWAVYGDGGLGFCTDSLQETKCRVVKDDDLVGYVKITTLTDGTFNVERVE